MILLQGKELKIEIKNDDATFVISDCQNKFIVDNVIEIEGKKFLVADGEVTKDWPSGKYKFQLIDGDDITTDVFIVKANLLYTDDAFSYWEKVLKAVDDVLAGKSNGATNITVGDKQISYMSISELLKLRDFALARLKEEKASEGEEVEPGQNDMRVIKYCWR